MPEENEVLSTPNRVSAGKIDRSRQPSVLLCLATIKFEGELDAKFVKCWKYINEVFLIIPLQNYKTLDSSGAGEAMIRTPRDWLVESTHPDFDLRCLEVIDLDDIEALPWFVRQG
jgi:hypothetical protein